MSGKAKEGKTKAVKAAEKKGKKEAGKKVQHVFSTGKRKKAVARASVRPGTGIVTFNSMPIDAVQNETMRLLLQEPLLLVGDAWKKFNIKVKTKGGGIIGQAQAARQAISRGLVQVLGEDVKKVFLGYDRKMLVYDPRRTEPHKPPRSSQGPRRYKQKSKR
jgi:small subunit ribosomal protein S9